ncbi:MAG: RNA-binding S4 domain-containing protein [Bacillota bacterium]|jgi:ribosomal 50S subunit-recycling heat shock protein|nr:RNA-binding S4 domain-containing protein [Bacillota bacterium]HHU43852.1 RNA-binding S4 domain-containing protein [Clostridiales bacterium]
MRLDKFLKVARIIKRRTVANQACVGQRALINGKEAKPAKKVKAGDIITVIFGESKYSVKVLKVPDGNVKKEEANALYEIMEIDK